MSERPDYISSDPSLPGKSGSYWLESAGSSPTYQPLAADIEADVVVIGCGLAGIMTAYELKVRGMNVVALEARSALSDVTGHTTAKVTAVHGSVINNIASRVRPEAAAIHVAENRAAVERIASLAGWLHIDCDLARVDTIAYVENEAQASIVADTGEVLRAAGLSPKAVETDADRWRLPYSAAAALCVEQEIRLHPVKFGLGVLAEFARLGGQVFEDSRVVELSDGKDSVTARTAAGSVKASAAVVCTHYPFHDHGSLFSRLYPHRSYVLGAYLRSAMPDDMYIALDDSLTLRVQDTDEGQLVIASGQHHKAGEAGDEREFYRTLEQQLRDRFEVERIAYHWSTQDNYTPDGLPFVGRSPGADRVYIATGFSAWGMSQAAVAAQMLPALISGADHHLSELYSPLRIDAGGSPTFLKENVGVTKDFVSTLFAEGSVDDIKPGEGRRVRKGVHRVAAYRDYEGNLHEVSATCTHVGCGLEFNDAEKTWDCPCHGSRFSVDGEVLHGPAVRDLEPR